MERMKHSANHRPKRTILFVVTLLLVMTNLALILNVIGAAAHLSSSRWQAATPYPTYLTYLPPAKQTIEVAEWQTQQAAALTPYPTGTIWSFPPVTITRDPITDVPIPLTPAGDGAIIDPYGSPSLSKAMGMTMLQEWYTVVGDRFIGVVVGSDYNDDMQGMVEVGIFAIKGNSLDPRDMTELPDGGTYSTPDRTGAVRIVGAQGKRLILRSTQGKTYYFDVPGQQFTTSLTASVPTATPWPMTIIPSPTPTLNGDAPYSPDTVPGLSPVNTPLHYILHHARDEHWFRFRLATPGTFQVHLTHLPANYDLYVSSVSYVGYSGQSTNPGNTDKLVVIQNAPVDDYMVWVVGVNGAFDPINAYQLEFDVPASTTQSTPTPTATLTLIPPAMVN